jgi:hypothetical protein
LTSRKIMTHVISSTTSSSLLHVLKASLIKASAAPSAFLLSKNGKTTFPT